MGSSALLICVGNLTTSSCIPSAHSSAAGISRSSRHGSHTHTACLGSELSPYCRSVGMTTWELHWTLRWHQEEQLQEEIRSSRLALCGKFLPTELYFWVKKSECWQLTGMKVFVFLLRWRKLWVGGNSKPTSKIKKIYLNCIQSVARIWMKVLIELDLWMPNKGCPFLLGLPGRAGQELSAIWVLWQQSSQSGA